MRKVENPGVLHLGGEGELRLFDTEQFQRVCSELPRPESQAPRVVHLIGRRQKTLALRSLLSHNNVQRSPTEYFAALRPDLSTINHENPLLFLDSDPFPKKTVANVPHLPVIQSYPLPWLRDDHNAEDVSDVVHARLLFTFADVVCIFLDDFPSLDKLFEKIEQWTRLGPSVDVDRAIRPRLLVVSGASELPIVAARLLRGLQDAFCDTFSTAEPFFLGGENLSPSTRYHRLKEAILNHTTDILSLKQQRFLSFSAVHLGEFFHAATGHCAKTLSLPFDFLGTARPLAKSRRDISQHLYRFFQLCQRHHVSFSDLILNVTSALLMDAYPPGMHIFDPAWVFREYYDQPCQVAFRQSGSDLCDSYCAGVGTMFAQFAQALQKGQSSVDLRLASFELSSKLWAPLTSNLTCLFCLIEPPEPPVFPCGHSICEACVLRCAQSIPHLEFHFFLDKCRICQHAAEITLKLKPPTAGTRVLTIDGGGTRAAIPLEMLRLLQALLDPVLVRDNFELGIGTSSGALIQLGIFAMAMDLETCSSVFDGLSRKVFGKSKESRSVIASAKKVLRSWTTDGVHDPQAFEDVLKTVLGTDKRLFGAPTGPVSGYRCAVVTGSIADAAPVVLGNYNGATPDGPYNGYEFLRPERAEDEPLLWEAARATSAAPGGSLFSTARVGDRDLQDGGLKHNNPCLLALWESRRLWPELKSPDLFLSLGTGSPVEPSKSRNTRFRHFLLDGFIPRLLRSCIAKTDGDVLWAQLLNSLDEPTRAAFFRANIPLSGSAQIDNTDSMAALRASVRSDTRLSLTLAKVAKLALVSNFYFQLDCRPLATSWGYLIQGSIRCRADVSKVLTALSKLGITSIEYSTDSEKLCGLGDPKVDICNSCHRYRKNVHFYLRDLSESISVYMKSRTMAQQRLSGFPATMKWFLQQQKLNSPFGIQHHAMPGLFRCSSCDLGSGSPHKRTMLQDVSTVRKRTRLHETIVEVRLEE